MEEVELEEVELVASGYEWACPTCGKINKEIEIKKEVRCLIGRLYHGCGKRFKVSEVIHAEN